MAPERQGTPGEQPTDALGGASAPPAGGTGSATRLRIELRRRRRGRLWRYIKGFVVGLLVTNVGDELEYAERYMIDVYDGEALKGTVDAEDHSTALGLLHIMRGQSQGLSAEEFLRARKLTPGP